MPIPSLRPCQMEPLIINKAAYPTHSFLPTVFLHNWIQYSIVAKNRELRHKVVIFRWIVTNEANQPFYYHTFKTTQRCSYELAF